MCPSPSLTVVVLVLGVPHISFTAWKSLSVRRVFAFISRSLHFSSIHFSLHSLAFLLISLVILLYIFLFSSLIILVGLMSLRFSLNSKTSLEIDGFFGWLLLYPIVFSAVSV